VGDVIVAEDLVKRFGDFTAVNGVSFSVHEGEVFGFLGPNGAGKTTTMRMIAGILQPSAGTIQIAGDDIAVDPIRAKSRLGFIPDRPFVYDKLTGAEFLRFVAALYGQQGDAVERRMEELLDLFELMPWKDELVESYSHGMRQKLIISSALLHRPEVIVVDEPMVGLDPKGQKFLKDLFRAFVDRGGTVLMSTHTLDTVEEMCDRVGIIAGGRILACGSVAEIRHQTEGGDANLEELFLKLTGGIIDREMDAILER
jgi:ABC-2 type transport system ATP-binding protein